MPKQIDVELKARAVRLVSEHRGEYPNLTAVAAVAKQVGVGVIVADLNLEVIETVVRAHVQEDGSLRPPFTRLPDAP